ncbi:hypothetical protein QYS46_21955 [Klebsiella michiganensis]|nr:hypothetical protein [Klebsiella michiganensis]
MVAHQKLFSQTRRPKPMQQQTQRYKAANADAAARKKRKQGSSLLVPAAQKARRIQVLPCCPLAHRQQKTR